MHKMKRIAAVGALAFTAMATVGVTTASAANDDRASCAGTKITLNDDWGCVISYGDRMKFSDQTWDGNGARLHWTSSRPNEDGNTEGYCKDYNGSENGTVTCDHDFPEGTTVIYKIEQISDGSVVDDTYWHQAVV